MTPNDWLDRIAADLLHVEAEIRTTLRTISRQPFGGPARPHTIAITLHQARTLLRGAMPAPIATTRLRGQHAKTTLAMQNLAGHLVALNDPLRSPEHALAAAERLLSELRTWHHQVAWSQATRKAKISGWTAPRLTITPVMQQPTNQTGEHDANIPNAARGQAAHPAAAIRHVSTSANLIRTLRLEQLELDLTHTDGDQIVDLRQLALTLQPRKAA